MYKNNDELQHYGVVGMRWGVRRATKKLNAAKKSGDKDKQERALNRLDKHRTKITKKIKRLNAENEDLQKEKYKMDTKINTKAASKELEIARLRNKARNAWTEKRAQKYNEKAEVLTLEVNELKGQANDIKARIEANKTMTETFSKTLSQVNDVLVANGREYVKR